MRSPKRLNIETIKFLLERAVAILVIIDILDKISDFFAHGKLHDAAIQLIAQFFPEPSGYSRTWEWITTIIGFVVAYAAELALLSAILLILVLVKSRNTLNGLTAKFNHLTHIHNEMVLHNSRYKACEETFKVLAAQNARADREIFHSLFVDAQPGIHARMTAVRAAQASVNNNIIQILDAAAALFGHMTGDCCAVCVQVLDTNEQQSVAESRVQTVERDSLAATKRPLRNNGRLITHGYLVKENTLNRAIFVDNNDFIAVDNLTQKINSRQVKTTSKTIGATYDAVLIAAIPQVHATSALPPATLCVDNMLGGFEGNPVCEHFAKELVWRLSVMLYRLNLLHSEYQRLKTINDGEVK